MNTYHKYLPNVFLAKCTEQHEKGTTIPVTTKHGKENDCIVFNYIGTKDGHYFYSIVRADGFNAQEHAKRKLERIESAAQNAEKKSDSYWKASHEGRDFLVLGEPIKIGHHSERRHRALIERNHNRMDKAMEFQRKAEQIKSKADYWEDRTTLINLSMPECTEYYQYKLQKAKQKHEDLKSGKLERSHSFSLTYAKKEVNELEKLLKNAVKLWGDNQ